MYHSFEEMEAAVLSRGTKKKIALACAQDEDVLAAVVNARRKGIADAVLIGDVEKIKELLSEMEEPEENYEFVECGSESACANMAFQLVLNGQADIPMKGLMQTANFMRAVLNKEYGFVPPKGLLSQATILESDGRLMIVTDCAVNIEPDYSDKVKIIENAVKLANSFGIEVPKVACVTPVEVINPKMQSTIDAAMLSKANQRGQIKNCIIDGPFGMDNALSKTAAQHKHIVSDVAGEADILLMPDLAAGNIFTKAIVYFADDAVPSCGVLTGTTIPVVMTSRTDTPLNKYRAILIATL